MDTRGMQPKPTGDNPTAETGGTGARPRARQQAEVAGERPAADAPHAERTERRQFVVDLMVAALVLVVLGAGSGIAIVLIARLFT